MQKGLAPRVFEHIFSRIAEEEDAMVCHLKDGTRKALAFGSVAFAAILEKHLHP